MGLIGTSAEPPSLAEAEAFFEAWTAGLPDRLAWFETQVAAEGGPVLDGSTVSLEPALRFLIDRISDQRPVHQAPMWFTAAFSDVEDWSPYGAALAEGLMAYVAEIYRRYAGDGAMWELDTDARSIDAYQPVMRDRRVAPAWTQVFTAIVQVQRASHGNDRLRNFVEASLSNVRSDSWIDEPEGTDLSVELTPLEEFSEWDVQVSVAEDLVDTLGFEAYASLEDRFGAVPGVVEAMFEDREVCLLKLTPGVDLDAVRLGLEGVLADLAPAD